MPFDPNEYARQLDMALGYGQGGYGSGAGVAGVVPYAPPKQQTPFTDSGEGPWDEAEPILGPGAQPRAAIDGAPAGGSAQPPGNQGLVGPNQKPGIEGDKKQMIEAKPPFKVEYDQKKLEGAKSFGEVMDSMKPKSQSKYMDWWESKYGSIQDKWAQVQESIGQRPDRERDMSRKEAFKMLMEFGVHLMRNAGDHNAGGKSFSDAYGGHLGRRDREVADWDQQNAVISKGRKDELDAIGSYGEAMKTQSQMDENERQGLEAEARAEGIRNRAPEVENTDDGLIRWNGKTQQYERITIDGKAQTAKTVNTRGGAARDSRTAQKKNIDDLMARGVPEQLALDIVYKRISDPRKAYATLYGSLRRNFSSEQEAREEADRLFTGIYGEDWESKPSAPAIQKDDPLGLR